MIQRIQTIWFFLAAACAALSLKLPFYVGTTKEGIGSYELKADAAHFVLMLVTIIVIVLPFICIFLFKDRTMQLRLSLITLLVEAVLIFLYYRETKTFQSGTLALSAALHAGIIFFIILAILGINKDNRIIKESDRLR